jgi:signal transduction histidine kinase
MRLMVGDSSASSSSTSDYVVIGPEPEVWAVINRQQNEPSWLKDRAIPGSEVELKGVLGFSRGAREFRIRLRTPSDIAMVSPSSWFTLAHIGVIVAIVGSLFAAALAWIILLKRTIRKRTEEIQEREVRLYQAQKMEVLNQMAGGIAHDFNNVLMAMNGYSELLLSEPLSEEHKGIIREIIKAGQRGAGLTRQLLTFSRRQLIAPTLVDVNGLVAELQPMLSRLVGDEVRVTLALDSHTLTVRADRSQLEQVLINFAVNARDAMPSGGTLHIATSAVTIAGRSHGLPSGPYVKLVVSDTGVGMDAKTLSRVFEPFFTTKQIGKGTGLGLSTVYGIVRQNDGEVKAQSLVGEGTTFTVYLPQKAGADELKGEENKQGGADTVLTARQ